MTLPTASVSPADAVLLLPRYQALLQAARNVYALHDLNGVVEQILRHSLQMMHVEACSMYLPDPATKQLIIYSARGEDDSHIHSARIPWDVGIAGSVFQKQQLERIDNVQDDPRFNRDFDRRNGFHTRAMICFPLLDNNQCLGVLQCINPLERDVFDQKDEEILEGLARILTASLQRLSREQQSIAEARLAQELIVAQEIQKSFLPPDIYIEDHAEFHVRYQAARTIGGDFYASMPYSHGRFLIATGDVSGKGIPAALTTAQVTGQLSVLASISEGGLADLVSKLNHSLYGRLAAGRFVATTFMLYDPAHATMEVCCAGQFAPWRWLNDQWQPTETHHGLPLGIFSGFTYHANVFPCQPGEKWLLFSDGINEGRNAAGEDYGNERLKNSLTAGSPRRVLDRAWAAWSQFAATQDLHDDACLTIFGCRPGRKLSILSRPQQCKVVRNFIESWTFYAGFNDIERGQIQLAVDEAVTNIMRHTYCQESDEVIEIGVEFDDQNLTFRLRDFGPTLKPEQLKKKDLADVRPGGLGLHLLEMTFQTVRFEPHDPGNELILIKALP